MALSLTFGTAWPSAPRHATAFRYNYWRRVGAEVVVLGPPTRTRAPTRRTHSSMRKNSDEELRRLERLALEGDEDAYERYIRETRRRGLDQDQAELELLRRSDDPTAFLASEIGEEARRLIKNEAESEIRTEANQKTAEGQSYHEEGDIWEIAWFGDAVAVNGTLVYDGHGERSPSFKDDESARAAMRHPENFELTRDGGEVPGGSEQEIEVNAVAEWVMRNLKLDHHNDALRKAVEEVVEKDFASPTAPSHRRSDYIYLVLGRRPNGDLARGRTGLVRRLRRRRIAWRGARHSA